MGRRGLSGPLKHLNRYRDRHGTWRFYYRPPGAKNIILPGDFGSDETPRMDDFGSDEFMAAYHAAAAKKKPPIGERRNASGTVAQAVALYLGSIQFGDLRPDTRRTRKNELERFREARGDKPIVMMERRHVERHIKDKTSGSARNCLKALAPFMAWCLSQGLIKVDPTAGIKRPVSANKDGYKTWSDDLVEQYRDHHAIGTKARSALELLVNVGAARVDTALLGRQHVRNGTLSYRRSKTDVLVEIPVLPDLQKVIDDMAGEGRLAFIATDRGTPYTKESFGNMFRGWCNEAKIPPGYAAHGLRKYAAVLRANLGATANELMAWFGWISEREATRYTRAADRKRLAIRLGEKLQK